MDRIYIAAAAVIVSLALASCSKDCGTDKAASGDLLTFGASVPEFTPGSKVIVENNGDRTYSIVWENKDAIVVNGVSSTGISISGADKGYAEFSTPPVSGPYCAVYPASAYQAGSFSTATRSMTLDVPHTQSYVKDNVDLGAVIMYAYSRTIGKTLAFRHAMAYLKVAVSGGTGNVRSVTVSDNGSEPVSGPFKMSFGSEIDFAPASADEPEGSSVYSIIYDCGTAGVAQGTEMMIAVPARTYQDGISLSVNVGGSVKTVSCGLFRAVGGCIYPATIAL